MRLPRGAAAGDLGRAYLKALAIFVAIVAGVLFAAVAIPLYRAEKARKEGDLAAQAERRAAFADFYLRQLDEKAKALASRSQIRAELAEYARGRIGLDALRASTRPKYLDGLAPYSGLAAAVRYAADGAPVASMGRAELLPYVPELSPAWVDGRLARVRDPEAERGSPEPGRGSFVEIRRVIAEGGRTIGHDALLFDASDFDIAAGASIYRLADEASLPAPEAGADVELKALPTSFAGIVLACSQPRGATLPDLSKMLWPFVRAALALVALIGAAGYLTLYRASARILAEARSLAERREMMIRETNHRVKNNLNIVSSLVQLYDFDGRSNPALLDVKAKIDLIELIHDRLYQSPIGAPMVLNSYLADLLDAIFKAHAREGSCEWSVEGDTITLPDRTCSDLGFIVSELAINAIKYGLREPGRGSPGEGPGAAGDEGEGAPARGGRDSVKVALRATDTGWRLEFSNTGRPFPGDVDPLASDSFGMELVRGYARQLRAKLSFSRVPETTYVLEFEGRPGREGGGA